MSYHRTDIVNDFSKVVGFGVFDNRGREIGARYCVQTLDVGAEPLSQFRPGAVFISDARRALPSNLWMAGRRVFSLYAHATRGGELFGACQSVRYFKTEEARSNALEKYLTAARRRAHKTAGVEMLVA